MQRVLSLLLAYVFLQTQAWALSGGPFQNIAGGNNIIGTYAGVLIPETDESTRLNVDGLPLATAIGLFAFNQPEVGFATGPFVAFIDGAPFLGTINGLIDPEDGEFRAVIQGASDAFFQVLLDTDVDGDGILNDFRTSQASGNIEAQIRPTGTAFSGTSTGLNSARVQGTAEVDVFLFVRRDGSPRVTETVRFEVEGFKQSDTATAVTLNFAAIDPAQDPAPVP